MKAIILAAGKGERIQNITKSIPKPMIVVNGKPILQHNIELCKKYGITEIYINVHHLSKKIINYFGDGEKFGVHITYSIEKTLQGTAGAVRKIAESYWNINSSITPFFVIYGDNYSNYDLSILKEKASETKSPLIIGFHFREDISASGVAEFGENGRVLKFIEKPKNHETNSHWVNAGIYYVNPTILEDIPEEFSDFGRDIFPLLLQKDIQIYGICQETEVKAFDTYKMIENNK